MAARGDPDDDEPGTAWFTTECFPSTFYVIYDPQLEKMNRSAHFRQERSHSVESVQILREIARNPELRERYDSIHLGQTVNVYRCYHIARDARVFCVPMPDCAT